MEKKIHHDNSQFLAGYRSGRRVWVRAGYYTRARLARGLEILRQPNSVDRFWGLLGRDCLDFLD
jgi:hypothetical protein